MTALRLAHRGDWRAAPENTIAAFEAALRVPACDGIEFDVRISSDGVPVILHDETLERVQGVAARADALTAAQLATHGVPALAEVCAAVGPERYVEVEFKVWVPTAIGVLESARGPVLDRTIVSSFEDAILRKIARTRPRWHRRLVSYDLDAGVIRRALQLGCAGVSVEWHAIGARGLAAARTANLTVSAWIVRRLPTYQRLDRLGLASICAEASALDG